MKVVYQDDGEVALEGNGGVQAVVELLETAIYQDDREVVLEGNR